MAQVSFQASGGVPPYTWSASGLPPVVPGVPTGGLSSAFEVSGNGTFWSTGVFPTPPGTYDVTFTVRDSRGVAAPPKTLPLTVSAAELRYLHRYYNADPEVDDHFYTINFAEVDCFGGGWFYEGTIGLLAPHGGNGRVELLRYWNPAVGDHLYTTNPDEADPSLIAQGSLGYLFVNQEPGMLPLLRYYSPAAIDHFYTTNPDEHLPGYIFEGVLGYVIAPPPYNAGCGDLHDKKVEHAIAHAFQMRRVNDTSGIIDAFFETINRTFDYTADRRKGVIGTSNSTDTVLRDAEYFLIGFRTGYELNVLQGAVMLRLLQIYNDVKAVAALTGTQEQLREVLELIGQANQNPNSSPGGEVWAAKGIMAGLAGGVAGLLGMEPLQPYPEPSSPLTRSVYSSGRHRWFRNYRVRVHRSSLQCESRVDSRKRRYSIQGDRRPARNAPSRKLTARRGRQ